MSFPDRLYAPGPKRLLSLDGGGVRGVISLGLLKRVETILRERHNNPKLVLSDYFDLIGGTSTGAIIATLLALGRSVADIEELYFRLASEVFRPKKSLWGPLNLIFRARFDELPLARILKSELGDRTLASKDLRAGLMIVAKRADTASVWPMVNIPTQKFYNDNKDLTLWEILRASTAAPTFFRPQKLSDLGQGEQGVFVDGAVSMHNSPALMLLMVATLKGFGLSWPLGEKNILLCSIGTGAVPRLESVKRLDADKNLSLLPVVMTQLLSDAAELNSTILQWFSCSPTAQVIDAQIGDLKDDLAADKPLISYLRYDCLLTEDSLNSLGFKTDKKELRALQDISNVQMLERFRTIGEKAAQHVSSKHFSADFDQDKNR